MKSHFTSLVGLCSLLASCESQSSKLAEVHLSSQQIDFAVTTTDSITRIRGQIDLPAAGVDVGPYSKFPVVMMIGGTGLFDRDYLFGNSGTARDLVFRDLAQSINQLGIATARFDYRGVKCNRLTMPPCTQCKTQEERIEYFRKTCLDEEVRKSVTPLTTQQDALAVYNFVQSNERIDPTKIIILAHSEGTIHVARLVGQQSITPRALLMLGTVAESPQSILHWQLVERMIDIGMSFDLDSDGAVTNAEVKRVCENIPGNSEQCKQFWTPPNGTWTKHAFEERFERDVYQPERAAALQHADTDPYFNSGFLMASYAWWKMWFTDEHSTLPDLFGFPGKISFNNGEIDSQTPGKRELGFVEASLARFNGPVRANIYPGNGHGFSTHPQLGPIDDASKKKILQELNWALE
jgi:hypothetical protein